MTTRRGLFLIPRLGLLGWGGPRVGVSLLVVVVERDDGKSDFPHHHAVG